MKNYSRVLSKQSLENIDLLKLANEASQENFEKNCVFNHKIWANSEIRTFVLPKSGGGAQTHLCPPTFESGEARAPLPPPPLLLRPWPVIIVWWYASNKIGLGHQLMRMV